MRRSQRRSGHGWCGIARIRRWLERPVKELAGFAKVTLEPGQSQQVRVALRERAFARWDEDDNGWVVDPGAYDLVVAQSAAREHVRIRMSRP